MTHVFIGPTDLDEALERSQSLTQDQLDEYDFSHLTQDGTEVALGRLQRQIYDLAEALNAANAELSELREAAGLRRPSIYDE